MVDKGEWLMFYDGFYSDDYCDAYASEWEEMNDFYCEYDASAFVRSEDFDQCYTESIYEPACD